MLLFDIGANIGRYAIKNYNASTKIICVEASPKTAEKLRKNVEEYKNIIVENLAISDSKEDTVTFYESQWVDTVSTLDINWLLPDTSRFVKLRFRVLMAPAPRPATLSVSAWILPAVSEDILY